MFVGGGGNVCEKMIVLTAGTLGLDPRREETLVFTLLRGGFRF